MKDKEVITRFANLNGTENIDIFYLVDGSSVFTYRANLSVDKPDEIVLTFPINEQTDEIHK